MSEKKIPDVVLSSDLKDTINPLYSGKYVAHALCEKGQGSFKMLGKIFHIKQGDFMIFIEPKWLSDFELSTDFEVDIILISNNFLRINRPNNNYDVVGQMSLFKDPIMPLTEEEKMLCRADFEHIRTRLGFTQHAFYEEVLGRVVSAFFLDLYHIHKRIYSEKPLSEKKSVLLREFIKLLENSDLETSREVNFYAEKLFVTPKYLSEVCHSASGRSAQFWIDRFTIIKIMELMAEQKYSFSQIAEMMNFSSVSYFSRYVKRILGISPRDFTEK